MLSVAALCSFLAGGSIYAGLVPIPGGVIAATMSNRVVAVSTDCRERWAVNLGFARIDYPQVHLKEEDRPLWYDGPVGCLSTPAVDTQFVYVVCATSGEWTLHKLRLADGEQVASVVIGGSVMDGAGERVDFNPSLQTNRSRLLLANGNVYIGFGGFSDIGHYHGWLFAYSSNTLLRVGAFCSTPDGFGGGIWMSGDAPSADEEGNIWIATGNGTVGHNDHAQSILKLSADLHLLASYTPPDWPTLNHWDADLGSTGVLLAGDRAIVGSKDFKVRSIRRDCMCDLHAVKLRGAPHLAEHEGIYEGREFEGRIYVWSSIGPIVTDDAASAPYAQAAFTIDRGVVWAITGKRALYAVQKATLRALDAHTLRELWHVDLGSFLSKYAAPTIADGFIYIPTLDGRVRVFVNQ